MKISIKHSHQEPQIVEAEFNKHSEPHLKEIGIMPRSYVFTTISELERFENREKKCRCATIVNEKVKLVLVEKL